jgi:hypothetical protein
MKDYPKVLIIGSEDIYTRNSSSTFTVRSFFDGWQKECLKQIVCGEGDANETTLVVTNRERLFCRWLPRKKNNTVSIQRNETQFYQKRFSFKQLVRQFIVNIYVLLPYLYGKRVKQFIDDFQPDIIYSSSQNVAIMGFINRISKKKGIPYIPHFFDDNSNMLFQDFPLLRRYALGIIMKSIHRAPVVFCISELMCDEYQRRYNYKHFVSLMHSVYPIVKPESYDNNVKTLLYAGSLYLGRYKTIVDLCKTIKSYGDSTIEFVIYTNKQSWDELQAFFEPYKFVRYGGFISQGELTLKIGEAYGLVFVESFDEEMLSFTRFSMSTKIPEYLSSNRPILAIGNEEQGSIKYLKENEAAYIISNTEQMPNMVPCFLERKGWHQISFNAKLLFINNHDRTVQKERFRQIIEDSVRN